MYRSSQIIGANGKHLFFAIKKGTDQSIFWRATVRIAIFQIDYESYEMDTNRVLTLSQFLKIFSTVQGQLVSALRHSALEKSPAKDESTTAGSLDDSIPSSSVDTTDSVKKSLSFSTFLNEVDKMSDAEKLNECCICLERPPDVMLPCAHAYCLPCIEQWNCFQKTCPICRESIESTNDAWVISDIPVSEEIRQEISTVLMDLSMRETQRH